MFQHSQMATAPRKSIGLNLHQQEKLPHLSLYTSSRRPNFQAIGISNIADVKEAPNILWDIENVALSCGFFTGRWGDKGRFETIPLVASEIVGWGSEIKVEPWRSFDKLWQPLGSFWWTLAIFGYSEVPLRKPAYVWKTW